MLTPFLILSRFEVAIKATLHLNRNRHNTTLLFNGLNLIPSPRFRVVAIIMIVTLLGMDEWIAQPNFALASFFEANGELCHRPPFKELIKS